MKSLGVIFVLLLSVVLVLAKPQASLNDASMGCVMCQLIAQQAQTLINNHLPVNAANFTAICRQFGPLEDMDLVSMLQAGNGPSKACEMIQYCIADAITSVLKPKGPNQGIGNIFEVGNGRFCGVCEWIVTQVQIFVQSGQTTSSLESTLIGLCNDLPSPASNVVRARIHDIAKIFQQIPTCSLMVHLYLPKIIAGAGNLHLPIETCYHIDLCPKP